jgi:RNA polymerase sigma factor (sigma-70 family)
MLSFDIMKKNMIPESDELLWTDFIDGHDEAYKKIYDSHIQSLFMYGCHFTIDEYLVQDCIQDLFIDLHNYRSKLGKTNNIKAYLFLSLKRKIIKKLDQEKKRKSINIDNLPFDYSLFVEDDAVNELNAKRIEYLEKAMAELSARQKEAIYLKFVSGLSYEELCSVLHMNYQAARNLVYRGMEKLRESCNRNSLFLWFSMMKKMFIPKN